MPVVSKTGNLYGISILKPIFWKKLRNKEISRELVEKLVLFGRKTNILFGVMFVCVEVLRPSQPNGVMSSVVSLPNHTFTGQA